MGVFFSQAEDSIRYSPERLEFRRVLLRSKDENYSTNLCKSFYKSGNLPLEYTLPLNTEKRFLFGRPNTPEIKKITKKILKENKPNTNLKIKEKEKEEMNEPIIDISELIKTRNKNVVEKIPIMTIEINIGEKIEVIPVCEGDTAYDLAKRFTEKNSCFYS